MKVSFRTAVIGVCGVIMISVRVVWDSWCFEQLPWYSTGNRCSILPNC